MKTLFPIKFANTILSQLPRTCFAVLVSFQSRPPPPAYWATGASSCPTLCLSAHSRRETPSLSSASLREVMSSSVILLYSLMSSSPAFLCQSGCFVKFRTMTTWHSCVQHNIAVVQASPRPPCCGTGMERSWTRPTSLTRRGRCRTPSPSRD